MNFYWKFVVDFLAVLFHIQVYGSLLVLFLLAARKIAGYRFRPRDRVNFWRFITVWTIGSLILLNQHNYRWFEFVQNAVFRGQTVDRDCSVPVPLLYAYVYPLGAVNADYQIIGYGGKVYAELYTSILGSTAELLQADVTIAIQIIWHVYLAGIVLFFLYHIVRYVKLKNKVRRVPVCTDPQVTELVYRERSFLGIIKPVPVRIIEDTDTSEFTSPFVIGFRRQEIILPAYQWEVLDPSGCQAVILHELVHVRHLDNIINTFLLILQSIFWMNPAVYSGMRAFQEDLECFRDQQITEMVRTGSGILDYTRTIISVAETILESREKKTQPVSRLVSGGLQRRMSFLLHLKESSVAVIIGLAAVFLLIVFWSTAVRVLFPLIQTAVITKSPL